MKVHDDDEMMIGDEYTVDGEAAAAAVVGTGGESEAVSDVAEQDDEAVVVGFADVTGVWNILLEC